MMQVWDKIGQTIINVLIFVVVIIASFAIYSFIFLDIMNKDYVSVFGYTYFYVASGSMSPSVNVGDVVVVKIDSDYSKGDIITYNSNGDFVTHRVISVDGDIVTTKGDANNTKDSSISGDSVIGKVSFILPKVGIWKNVFMTPKVLFTLILTLVLFSFTFSYNTKKKRKKLRRQREKRKIKEQIDAPIKDIGDDNNV